MPWHNLRTWVVHPAPSAEGLAEKLVGHAGCSCQGWSLEGSPFLNDQTSEDGAFEVAVVKPPAEPGGPWWQVESITSGWYLSTPRLGWPDRHCYESAEAAARERARETIAELISGARDPGPPDSVAWKCDPCDIETPEQHGRCPHCA
jgi:hypothetical protein